ncbi:hypothetical protein [Fredinandcohnia sp. 179-A 10B2 NHS]
MADKKEKGKKLEETHDHEEEKRMDSWEFFWGRMPASLDEEIEEE